jgi:CheY-like chemotaxis protein
MDSFPVKNGTEFDATLAQQMMFDYQTATGASFTDSLTGIDGTRASRILRSDARTESLPIIAVTSYAMSGDEEIARRAGCVEYVTKPIDTHRFPNLVAEIIQRFAGKDSNQSADPQNGAEPDLSGS